MKLTKRIVALILSVMIALSACISVNALTFEKSHINDIKGIGDYKQHLIEEGYPVFTTSDFYKIFNVFKTAFRLITGSWVFPEENFNLTLDPFINDVCNKVAVECGLDLVSIVKNLPETNQYSEILTEVFQVDTVEFRNKMYEKRDNSDNKLLSYIYYFIGVYMSVIDLCEIYSLPVENEPMLHEIYIRLVFRDGGEQVMNPKIVINSETGDVYYYDNKGIVGTGFNFNLSELLVYATVNCWMREYGFCLFYDIVANMMPIFFNYRTRRFKFDYNGMEYMIQIWKGNYLIANGGEVGIYCRDESKSGTYYDSANDEQMLNMSMQIIHGDKILVNKEKMLHWWINGFNLGTRMYIPESLTMKFSIEMSDEEMLNAFCKSIDNHYLHDVTYTVDDLTVNVVW